MAQLTRTAVPATAAPPLRSQLEHRAAPSRPGQQVCRAHEQVAESVTTLRAAKRKRLAEVVASLGVIDSSLEDLRTAMQPSSSSSSSSSSESEEDEPVATLKTKQQKVAVLEPPARTTSPPPASPDSLQLDTALQLDSPGDHAQLPATLPSAAAQRQLRVCMGKSCRKAGSEGVLTAAQSAAVGTNVDVQPCKCLDKCKMGPNVQLASAGSKKGEIRTGVEVWDLPSLMDA